MADTWAKRYGRRPCELLRPNVRDPELDAAVDLACMYAGQTEEIRHAKSGDAMGVYVVGG